MILLKSNDGQVLVYTGQEEIFDYGVFKIPAQYVEDYLGDRKLKYPANVLRELQELFGKVNR